jgi:hypothetical protein
LENTFSAISLDIMPIGVVVYEVCGDRKAAADCHRKVIEFVRAHPEQYEPDFTTTFEQLIAELGPPPAA